MSRTEIQESPDSISRRKNWWIGIGVALWIVISIVCLILMPVGPSRSILLLFTLIFLPTFLAAIAGASLGWKPVRRRLVICAVIPGVVIMLSIKHECLNQMILFGAGSLERAQREYTEHYLKERPHQGLGNDLIRGAPVTSRGRVEATERLGGLLKFYSRAA